MPSAGTPAARTIRRLYRGSRYDAYRRHPDEEQAVRDVGASPIYGELMPTATGKLLDYLAMGKDDVFYDLGCGVGKVVLQAAISVPLRRVVGIEMMPSRYELACRALARVEAENLQQAETCELWCADLMTSPIADATVIYACSTGFAPALLDRLADRVAMLDPSVRFVTVQALEPDSRFDLVDVLRLDTSWQRRTAIHVYQGLSELARVSRGLVSP